MPANPPASLVARLQNASPSQVHLLAHWSSLNESQQLRLISQLEAIDFTLVQRLFLGEETSHDWSELAARAIAPPAIRLRDPSNRFTPADAASVGQSLLSASRVGMILVAGGQGSRLGFEHPKGMFPLGTVSGRTLFEILIDHLLAVRARYKTNIPLYLMTSPATDEETRQFLHSHKRFGLPEEDLQIFCQGTMPAVDAATGKLLMDEPGELSLSPDGHGGMLAALDKSGCLADARQRGITQFFYGQIDNPLLQVCSPELLGYHKLAGAEVTTQVVRKRDPLERVGNVVSVDGRVQIIEYSDLPEVAARRVSSDGSLQLWAGNLAVHVFDREFLERIDHQSGGLPFHRAKKKVPYLDETGTRKSPDFPNAIKFERFIFDLLPAAREALVVEVDAAEAFAPVKNGAHEKTDTAATSQAAMIALHRRWLREAGVQVADNVPVEINPRFALDAHELAKKLPPGLCVTAARYFC